MSTSERNIDENTLLEYDPLSPFDEAGAKSGVSPAVVKRLPRYFRYLRELIRRDKLRVSSGELAKMMGVTASQVRQDFNCFGGFGQQGYGYNVRYLYRKISEILGVTKNYNAVIVGCGNLGRALAGSLMFAKRGVNVVGFFDNSPAVIGKEIAGHKIMSTAEAPAFCREWNVSIAVLTTPRENAVEAANLFAGAGVRGLWNFTNIELDLPFPQVKIQNVHMGDSLMMLCYDLASEGEETDVTDEN